MSLVNIGEGNRDDGFYRYKMPKLITKIEGRGNGIKTNIVNMVDVAKALARPPSYTTKFFGCVLGAQSKFDSKTGTATVNGAHDTSKMVQLLEIFIKKYVQCYGCGNPETEIIITKSQMITLKCAACGFVSDVDMRDKLTTFIVNNPPEVKKSKGKKDMRRAEKERQKAGEALDEEKKKSKSLKKKGEEEKKVKKTKQPSEEKVSPNQSQEENEEKDDDDDDVVWQTDTSAEAARKRSEEQLSAATSKMVMLNVIDEDPGSKSKAVNGKAESNGKPASDLPLSEKALSDEEERADEADAGEAEEAKMVDDLIDYLNTRSLADFLTHVNTRDQFDQDFMIAVFKALFNGTTKGLHKEVAKKSSFFAKLMNSEKRQNLLLGAIEIYCGVSFPEAVKEAPLLLKVLYDEDVLEEEHILAWYDRGAKSLVCDAKSALAVRKHAKPFVDWLREAEAESDEE